MKLCPLEEALIPGNIVEVTSTDKIKMGVVLSNNQIAYFMDSKGYDNIDSLVWRNNNNDDDYYISRVYTPAYGFSFGIDCDKLNCIYCRYPKYPCEVPDGVEYELVYGQSTFICKNMNIFGKDVVVGKLDGSDKIEVVEVGEFENDLVVELTVGEEDEE